MEEFNIVEDTLYVPMLGRIYASQKFSNVLLDEAKYYKRISKKGFNLVTKLMMIVLDKFGMVKMIHLVLNK